MLPSGDLFDIGIAGNNHLLFAGKHYCFGLNSGWMFANSWWMFAKLVLLNGKLGVMRVVTSQLGLTRPSSIFFSSGIVRDIVPPIIHSLSVAGYLEKPRNSKNLEKHNFDRRNGTASSRDACTRLQMKSKWDEKNTVHFSASNLYTIDRKSLLEIQKTGNS